MPAPRTSSRAAKAASIALLLATAAVPAAAYQYTVGVGKDQSTGQPGLGFDPSRTQIADPNTSNTIVFSFLEGIHRVVQTDGNLNAPCSPAGEFDTGVQTVPAGSTGQSFTFTVDNNTQAYYFADIGEDYSPCYLGAVFCVNTDETSSTTSCHAVQAAAVSLGKQQGVSTTPGLSTATSASMTSSGSMSMSSGASSASSSAMSVTSSRASSATSASASGSTGASRSNSAASPSSSFSSGAISLSMTPTSLVGGMVALAAGVLAAY
ncbi:hypothetical protein BMF94_5922 [Rhodotorula taiwanensis]|uniref:Phytocyanin domain-containing protein n=1 Tax=Rhodotorula taiwanensis TaxID=741276 RepID=A0A2S5B2J5_9BASI|nr:hypothetical protein BMF94_5922 [Rhodotorula taiwanensis]